MKKVCLMIAFLPIILFAKNNSSMSFDGIDDCVNLSNRSGIQDILPTVDKQSIIIFDLLGRQVDSEKKNLLLLEKHEDSSVYKKYTIE